MLIIKNLKGLFSGEGFQKKNGRLIKSGDASFLKGPIDLLIDPISGKIKKIGKAIDKAGALFFDGSERVATSGFIDSHTHFIFSGDRSSEYFMRWAGKSYQEISAAGGGIHNTVSATAQSTDESLFQSTIEKIIQCAHLGTTTLEIKSGYANSAQGELRLLKIISQLKTWAMQHNAPKIFSTFLGLHALPQGVSEKDYVDQMISILKEVSSDHLADFVDAFPEKGFFSLSETKRFALAAKSFGIPSKIHADELSNLETSKEMSQLGALSVDHLQMISDSGIETLKRSSTVATLLPATSFYLGLAYTNARKLLDSGVQVALATDYNPGTAPSFSMLQTNLLAATQLKMSPTEILCASTYNGASALNAASSLGLLCENYLANFCLWSTKATTEEKILEEIVLNGQAPESVFIDAKILRP